MSINQKNSDAKQSQPRPQSQSMRASLAFHLTAFFLCALGAGLCYAGARGLQFLSDAAQADALLASMNEAPEMRREKLRQTEILLAPWIDQLGYAFKARLLLLEEAKIQGSPQKRLEAARAVVLRAPLEGKAWEILAEATERASRTPAPPPEVFDYVRLSQATEPWEAQSMYARAIFILRMWRHAPLELRSKAINTLVGFAAHFTAQDIQDLKALCATLASEDRNDIRAQMSAVSKDGAILAQMLGFIS